MKKKFNHETRETHENNSHKNAQEAQSSFILQNAVRSLSEVGWAFLPDNWRSKRAALLGWRPRMTALLVCGILCLSLNLFAATVQLTISASPAGKGTTSPWMGVHSVNTGEAFNIIATPITGWRFMNWTIEGGATVTDQNDSSTSATLSANGKVTANFEDINNPSSFNLTIQKIGNGTPSPAVGTYKISTGVPQNITAVPDVGWAFQNWTYTGSATIVNTNSAITQIAITSDVTLTANFKDVSPGKANLTVSATTGGTVTAPGIGTFQVNINEAQTITASANAGYYFVNWTASSGTITDASSISTTITVAEDTTLSANFGKINQYANTTPYIAGAEYFIDIDPGEGNGTALSSRDGAFDSCIEQIAPTDIDTTGLSVDIHRVGVRFKDSAGLWGNVLYYEFNVYEDPNPPVTMTMAKIGSGSTSPSGAPTVNSGEPQAILAYPASGYSFVNWTAMPSFAVSFDDANAYSTNATLSANATITANFQKVTPTLTMAVNGTGSTTPAVGAHLVDAGLEYDITATSGLNYHFVNWTTSGGATSIANVNSTKTTVEINSDATVTANFLPNTTTLIMALSGSGTISPIAGESEVDIGQAIDIIATPDTGNHFVNWTADPAGNANFTDAKSANTKVSLTGICTITANFTINTYVVNFINGLNGTLTGDTSQIIEQGKDCKEVAAVPDANYHFVNWTGDYAGTDNPLTITNVTKNMNITANFAINTYTVTFIEGANGTITGTKVQTVNHGGSGTAVSAVAETGYHFTGWTGDVIGTDNPLTVSNVTKDMSITANFAINTYVILASAGANGTISPNGNVEVNHGASQSFIITPEIGYHVEDVLVDGSSVGTVSSYEFTNVTEAHTITASFAINVYDLTFTAGANGTITGTSPQSINHGTNATAITAVPNENYHFVDWTIEEKVIKKYASFAETGTGKEALSNFAKATLDRSAKVPYSSKFATANLAYSTDNPLTVTNVTSSMTITANFAINTYTVTFDLDGKGTRTGGGEIEQTIGYGSPATAPLVEGKTGWVFTGWDKAFNNITADLIVKALYSVKTWNITVSVGANGTITPSGTVSVNHAAEQAFTITADLGYYIADVLVDAVSVGTVANYTFSNVTSGHTISASFAATPPVTAQLTMASSPVAGGVTRPVAGTSPVNTQTLVSITATANEGYNFANWSATANATITNANSAVTSVTLNGDATVTANFSAVQATAQLTMSVSPEGSGTTTPAGTSIVNTGEVQAITATANEGYYFVNWGADSAAAVFGNASSAETTVTITGACTLTANFAEIPNLTDMAYGRIYTYTGILKFQKTPKIIASYTDPVSLKTGKKAALKVLTKLVLPTETVRCEWKGRITLFNKKLWDKTLTCEDNLLEIPIETLSTNLYVNGTDSEIVLDLVPPEIEGVYDKYGLQVYSGNLGDKLTIKGTFFGVTPPVIWMEYPVYDDLGEVKEIKCLRLKCYKVLKYRNSKNVPGKSCMEIETGLSEITVYLPSKWPNGWDHSEYHNIVIDNKVGRATIQFQTEE